jgi:hypothetical protein
MDAFISALTGGSGLTSSALWTEAAKIVPWLLIIVPFAFGYNLVKKSIKGAARGKVKF